MTSTSLPTSLAHLIINEEVYERRHAPTLVRRSSSRGSSLSRTSDTPSLGEFELTRTGARRLSTARASISPPLHLHAFDEETEYPLASLSRKNSLPPIHPPSHHYSSHYTPRTAPLPLSVPRSAAPPPHELPLSLPRRHSHQQQPYARPTTSTSHQRPETSYESVHPSSGDGNPGGRPAVIVTTTKACNHCRSKKIRCYPGKPLVEGGELTTCSRCKDAGFECGYSGPQKKRGPCPGTTRPGPTTTNTTGSTSVNTKVSPTRSSKNKALPATDPIPKPDLIPSGQDTIMRDHEGASERERERERERGGPESSRSSITSFHILTPEEDRRGSYGFTNTPNHSHSHSHYPSQHTHSAPIHPGHSSAWPKHSTQSTHSGQSGYQDRPPTGVSRTSTHQYGSILSWPNQEPATELDHPAHSSIPKSSHSHSHPHSQGRGLFDVNYSLKPQLPPIHHIDRELHQHQHRQSNDMGSRFGPVGRTLPPILDKSQSVGHW